MNRIRGEHSTVISQFLQITAYDIWLRMSYQLLTFSSFFNTVLGL